MLVSRLYKNGPLKGQDIYIVGLGPSMRRFPVKWLRGRFCVLLNDAWQAFPGLGPVAFLNGTRHGVGGFPEQIKYRIIKGRARGEKNPGDHFNVVKSGDPRMHVFSTYDSRFDALDQSDPAAIYHDEIHYASPGATVAEYAIQFCALAGAATIYLVGIDCSNLGEDLYYSDEIAAAREAAAVKKDTWDVRDYAAYIYGLRLVKEATVKKFGIHVLSLTPFVGLGNEQEQYASPKKVSRPDPAS